MRFHLLTLGCPKNVVDSEAMSASLAALGHIPVAAPGDADLMIVNTCGNARSPSNRSMLAVRAR